MIVHHPDRLHQGVHRRGTNEGPAPTFQILRKSDGLSRSRPGCRVIRYEIICRSKRPEIRGERTFFFDEIATSAGIRHDRLDLLAVSDDRRISNESIDVDIGEEHKFLDIEVREDFSQPLAADKNRRP